MFMRLNYSQEKNTLNRISVELSHWRVISHGVRLGQKWLPPVRQNWVFLKEKIIEEKQKKFGNGFLL